MSRGIIILIAVLSIALCGLLILPRLKNSGAVVPSTNLVAAASPSTQTAPQPGRTTSPILRTTPSGNVQTTIITGRPPARANPIFTIETNAASITNLLEEPVKTLPELERDYASTTNRDSRLDAMMDIAEASTADSVRALTRLFDLETDPDLKVDLLDSLLGIDGFKDEKLIMLTLGIRQGLPGDVRQSAIDGLIDLEDTRSIALLNGLLNDPDPEIRQSAQDAIEILQTPPAQIPKLAPNRN